MSFLLRVGALASLADPSLVAPALIAAHGAARASLPMLMFLVPPARNDGLSFAAGHPPYESAGVAALLGILILTIALGFWPGVLALILLAIVLTAIAWLTLAQIDGQTGDVLGASEQVGEILILLVALL
jgi:adenosylcobinamide-GDP ribazoletransferase